MAIDGKYGKVTLEHGQHIPADEPVIVFRAKDKFLPKVLAFYSGLCEEAGSPARHLDMLSAAITRVMDWQATHETKVPDSETSRAWMD